MASALAAGLAPALGSTAISPASLRGGDGATAGGFRGARAARLRDVLLVAEAAFAVMLLVAATLVARSFGRLTHVDAGYTATNVLAVHVFVPGAEGPAKRQRVEHLVDAALERIRAVAGVAAAGAANMMPLDNTTMIAGFPIPGSRPTGGGPPATIARALQYFVSPGYPEAVALRVRAGRLFRDADRGAGMRAWVVNEEFARKYLTGDPIGFRWESRLDGGVVVNNEVIGVVGNVLKNGNDGKPQPEVYRLADGVPAYDARFELAIRTTGDPAAIAPQVRDIVRGLEPSAAVETAPLAERLAATVEQPRFAALVLAAFALLALALASVGIYGVLAYAVSQRRRELGVRAALGASRRTLIALVVRDGLATCVVGLAVGIAAAAMLTRFMAGVLFGVTPLDPIAFVGAPILLFTVALAASVIPGRKAASIDPAEALRCE
jgi:predicted permease